MHKESWRGLGGRLYVLVKLRMKASVKSGQPLMLRGFRLFSHVRAVPWSMTGTYFTATRLLPFAMLTAVEELTSQSSGFTEPVYLGVSLGRVNPLGKGSSRMRGPKHGGPSSSSSSSTRDRWSRSIRRRASFSPTPSRRPRGPPRVGCSTGGGETRLSLRGGGGT